MPGDECQDVNRVFSSLLNGWWERCPGYTCPGHRCWRRLLLNFKQPVRKQAIFSNEPAEYTYEISSDCILSPFARSDSDHFIHRRQKDLSIPDLPCLCGAFNRLDDLGDQFIDYDQFDLGFR
jgi:hypothetical protein